MRTFLTLLSVSILAACNAPEMPLPGITGKAGELVIVMPEKNWKAAAGDTVFNALSAHIYGLPQAEPLFNVVHIKSAAFSKIFQTHRNILIANIDKEHNKKIELKNDVWATPQVVVEIWASNNDEFIELFKKNEERIINNILKKERDRIQKSYNAQLNPDVVTPIKEQWGLALSIPKGYNMARQEDDFMWVRYETKDVTQSILIYSEPYTSDSTFTVSGMVEMMDKYANMYIPGPDKGTYMTTFVEYPPKIEDASIADQYASKLVGLWNVEGALMGGPYNTYAFLNPAGDRVFYLHGFVFAPGKDKRNYVRQVDTILKSASFVK